MKNRTVDLGGPVHLADFGGDGRPIVLVHGLGGSFANWMAVGGALAARGRVLAPDLLGFGRTPLAGRDATVESNVAMLSRFLEEEARAPAVLVGNSMGGLVSVLTAAARPDLVDRLVLVGPALPRPRGTPLDPAVAAVFGLYLLPGAGEMFLRWRLNKVGPERVLRATLRLCGLDPSRILPEAYAAAVELARERHELAWANQAFLQAARSLMRVNLRRDRVYEAIRRIRAPGLVTQGSADRLVPPAVSRAVAEIRPDWRLEVMEGVGHVPQLEVPEAWMRLVTAFID